MKNYFKIGFAVLFTVFTIFCFYQISQVGKCQDKKCCGLINLAAQSSDNADTALEQAETETLNRYDLTGLSVVPSENKIITLGDKEKTSDYFFQLDLDSKAAAIDTGILNRYEDLSPDEPKDYLELIKPVKTEGGRIIKPLANTDLILIDQKLRLRLDELDWQTGEKITDASGMQSAEFTALILDAKKNPALKISKRYSIQPKVHHIDINISVENLTDANIISRFDLQGPTGLPREEVRSDGRKIVAGYVDNAGQFGVISADKNAIRSEKIKAIKGKNNKLADKTRLVYTKPEDIARYNFIWAAAVDKYFAAIIRPVPFEGEKYASWISIGNAEYYEYGLSANPDQYETGNENLGFKLRVNDFELGANEKKNFAFQMFVGPKDKDLFENNELYKSLGFMNAIDFQACCGNWFKPLSFFILWLMKAMYEFIPNYGLVIIILVLLVRLILHPVTKKSQVSMMGMQKLAPKAEEIRKKYANDKTEMNKQMATLYKEQGLTPIMGCLPMVLQMPIWIALYSAIYASIDLRGAAFLPFWITDLSAPDALVRFKAVHLPLIGALDSFNLLPILLGVSFFLQQKLMPQTTSASANPQVQQQQKMMLWMMPIMMLMFLYKAPSGLNLYIMASTFGGVIEQTVIRKHIREREELESQGKVAVTAKTGGKLKKKKPKPIIKY